MSGSAADDIKRALAIVRNEAARGDAALRWTALHQLAATMSDVVELARKMNKPRVTTKTVSIPQTKAAASNQLATQQTQGDATQSRNADDV